MKNSLANDRLTNSRGPREGYLYVAVLFTSLVIVATVTAALTMSTASIRTQSDRQGRFAAVRLAESEIQRLVSVMNSSDSWRNKTNNVYSEWLTPVNFGGPDSKVRHRLFDSDGDLADDPSDSVLLTVHAQVHRSEAALTVEIAPQLSRHSVLDYGVTTSRDLDVKNGGTLTASRAIQVANDCENSSGPGMITTTYLRCTGVIEPTVRAQVIGGNVKLPTHDVVDEYVQVGTEISLSSLPLIDSERVIEDQVLSSTYNPYGSADANGIYWIDADNTPVVISHSRLDATLAIKNASEIILSGGLNWHYPLLPEAILVTDGDIAFEDIEWELDEGSRSTNFNPPVSPYRGTISNANSTDIYPTEFRGAIYTSGDIECSSLIADERLQIWGTLIARDIKVKGYVSIHPFQLEDTWTPRGFIDYVPVEIVRGSYRRVSP